MFNIEYTKLLQKHFFDFKRNEEWFHFYTGTYRVFFVCYFFENKICGHKCFDRDKDIFLIGNIIKIIRKIHNFTQTFRFFIEHIKKNLKFWVQDNIFCSQNVSIKFSVHKYFCVPKIFYLFFFKVDIHLCLQHFQGFLNS